MKCPGQDTRSWKPDDIFEIGCPFCGIAIEFFKDDTRRRCKNCNKLVPNPRINLGCIEGFICRAVCGARACEKN